MSETVTNSGADASVVAGELATAQAEFRRAYPSYDSTSSVDALRQQEYARLDTLGHTYLDYTGGGLYADKQIRAHMELLQNNVFGNPHSNSPTSLAMTALDEQARTAVLEYFNASPDEYVAIWTANATGALKLVGEAYPFSPDGRLLLSFDNHNSVNGIREYARAKGAALTYLPVMPANMRLDEQALLDALGEARPGGHNLFAYPAQSNFTGVQHPLEWIVEAQACNWDVVLDAAAFVPTNRLDLGRWHPDFVALSFYKLFGYPTGVGCLLARKESLKRLRRPWFSGGTIFAVSVQGDGFYPLENEARFEDGTLNYLSLPAVTIGLDHVASTGIDVIHERVMCLTGWLIDELIQLRHENGQPLVRLYGPPDRHLRGGTIALNFLDPAGHIVDERIVDRLAAQRTISIRTGCFCNPGAGEIAFKIGKEPLVESFHADVPLTYDGFLAILGLESGGAARISFGIVSNFADAYRFLQFACGFLNTFPHATDLKPREHC